MSGFSQRICSAVMMPSRPNAVLNHGTPAYGYGPLGVAVIIIRTSAMRSLDPVVERLVRRVDDPVAARCIGLARGEVVQRGVIDLNRATLAPHSHDTVSSRAVVS